jgi:diguanylate cyclase (GGDEF)-like protein
MDDFLPTIRHDPTGVFPPSSPPGLFLASSETVLAGRVDGTGEFLAANRGLQRWLGPDDRPGLERVLLAPSLARWRAALHRSDTPGSGRYLTLRFRREGGRVAAYRCLLAEGDDALFWFFGEPIAPRRAARGQSVQALRDELEQQRRRARRLARTDALTGLANRRQADRWLVRLTTCAQQRHEPLACLMVDLDRFKEVNDTLGHSVGDVVLKEAARLLAQGLRRSDRLARFGGEEFLILLPETTGGAAVTVAERLRALLAARRVEPLGRPLTASFGIATLQPGETAEILLNRADAAMLRAKRDGRNRVELDDH